MSLSSPIKRNTKRTAFACFLCCVCVFVSGQAVWNRTFVEDRPLMLFSSIEKIDSIYHVIGVTVDKGGFTNKDRLIIGELNETGDFNRYQSIYDSVTKGYSAYLNALILNRNKELLYTGYATDSQENLLVFKKNTATGVISTYEYATPNSYAFQGYKIVQTQSSYFVTGVHTDRTINSANNFLVKLDSNFNRVWQKYYGQSNRLEFARSLIVLANGNLLMGSVRNDFNNSNERSNTWLIEVDTDGTIVRQWLDTNDSTYVAEGLLQTQDGGFIYGAQKKNLQSVNDVYKIATIVKMDNAFNKQWTYSAGRYDIFTGIYDIIELQDGSFIACGNKPYYNNDSSVRSGWIIKLSQSGQVIWDKVYKGIATRNTENFLIDIDILSDGSLMAVGQCQQSIQPRQLGWFLKLDSNGCEVENCLVGIEGDDRQQTIDDRLIQIEPNPATGTVQLTIDNEMIGGVIRLYNITGALVLQQTAEAEKTQLNITALSKGMYIVTLQKQGQIARGRLVVE